MQTISSEKGVYQGRQVALLTKHGKERVIPLVLDAVLGCQVGLVTGYDTDLLGTFTRNIPRVGTQLNAARIKARLGMDLAGLPTGVASEGSFGADPLTRMLSWNVEMVIWIDDILGIEVVGVACGATRFSHVLTANWEEVETFARAAGFPEHGLVARPHTEDDPRIRKDITDWETLREAFRWASGEAGNGCAFLEADARAHMNPTRMGMIGKAAQDLAGKLCTLCPTCDAPGFQMAERISGLFCEDCCTPTRESRVDIHRCARCGHQVTVERPEKVASASRCDYCNP